MDTAKQYRNERGQALPLGLAFLLVAVLAAALVHDSGRFGNEKMRLANTADAAAYNAMLWPARSMNFTAYLNRAMVANQVAIAQQIALRSWIDHARQLTDNLSVATAWIPYLGQFMMTARNAVVQIEHAVHPVTRAAIGVLDTLAPLYSTAQEAMFHHALLAAPEAVQKMVEASDSRYLVNNAFTLAGTAAMLAGWQRFTDQKDHHDAVAMRERVELINRSRDKFSRQRDWRYSLWPASLRRRGSTRLEMSDGPGGTAFQWRGKDVTTLRISSVVGSSKTPLGWGSARATDGTQSPACVAGLFSNHCGRWFGSVHRRAERLAELPGQRVELNNLYNGVRAFRDLSAVDTSTLKLRVEVSLPIDQLPQAQHYKAGGMLDLAEGVRGNTLSSVSVAELFYERPDRYRHRFEEAANAYNPYWSVRLAPIELVDRATALAARSQQGGQDTPLYRALYRELSNPSSASMPGNGAHANGSGLVSAVRQTATPSGAMASAQGLVSQSRGWFGQSLRELAASIGTALRSAFSLF